MILDYFLHELFDRLTCPLVKSEIVVEPVPFLGVKEFLGEGLDEELIIGFCVS